MQKDIVLRAFLKKNMKLPELFEEKMRRLLGEDFSEYEKHLDDPAYYGIRVNTLKDLSGRLFEDLSVSCDESALDR